jgi:uncharacterized protein
MIGFIIIALITQGLLFFVHFVFYRFGVDTFHLAEKYRHILGISLAVLSLSFTSSMILVQKFENKFTENFYYISAIWLGTVFWVFIAIVLATISRYVILNDLYYSVFSGILIVSAFLLSFYGVSHARNIQVVKKDIYMHNLPASWEGKKAVFMSDLHYGNIHGIAKAKKDLSIVQSLDPDILLIAGDFFDGPKKNLKQFSDVYRDYNPIKGKYFVSGNHEEYAGLAQSFAAIRDAGFVILDNKDMNIDGVQLLGVPYTTNGPSDTDLNTTKSVLTSTEYKKELPSILIKHIPIDLDIVRDIGVSFAFFGHTHHGQFWPLSLIVDRIYGNHAYGFSEENSTIFYTSSGVGSWGPPQRIGTDSELLLVTFHNK